MFEHSKIANSNASYTNATIISVLHSPVNKIYLPFIQSPGTQKKLHRKDHSAKLFSTVKTLSTIFSTVCRS